MKKLFLIFLIFTSCKKNPETVKIHVNDAINNSPAKGVIVEIHRCTSATNPFCGLIAYNTSVTGDDGTCSFTKDDFVQTAQMRGSSANYWGRLVPKSTSLTVYPAGWVRLHILRSTNYPPESTLYFTVQSSSLAYLYGFYQYNAAADSSILVKGFGGLLNKIDWEIKGPTSNILNSGTWNQQLPRLDTISAVLNY
jgi:hypothetical protein